jgi:hypothetical protein
MMPDTINVEAERMCVLEEVVTHLVRPSLNNYKNAIGDNLNARQDENLDAVSDIHSRRTWEALVAMQHLMRRLESPHTDEKQLESWRKLSSLLQAAG